MPAGVSVLKPSAACSSGGPDCALCSLRAMGQLEASNTSAIVGFGPGRRPKRRGARLLLLRPCSLHTQVGLVQTRLSSRTLQRQQLSQGSRLHEQGAWWAAARRPGGRAGVAVRSFKEVNRELLVGDLLCLICFALYKQITAIILLPTFPGWLAPLAFNPIRFLEFASFTGTLCGTWVGCGLVAGGYRFSATADVATALRRTCRMWLAAMPVSAAQLVLLTAAEDGSLVGTEGFARALPLAASGPGEPFVSAAQVLLLLTVWRLFYTTYLDVYSWRTLAGSRLDRAKEQQHFLSALQAAALLSLVFCLLLQFLALAIGEEQLEVLLGL